MKRVKFGRLMVGDYFYFRGDYFRKIDESFGVLVGTTRCVEFGFNLTVEIED
jgi:hypothetical protein